MTNDRVSFVSGRGGVGKTVISLSLAKFLSLLGDKKVLLIDFDLTTHGASHFFKDEIEEMKRKNKESQSPKGILELLDVLKECKFQQQREKIVELLDELTSDDENKIQHQKEKILKLLDELANHKIDKNQQMRELIIALIDELVVSKQENKKDEIQQLREKIVELLDRLVSGKVEKLVESNLLFIKAEKKGGFDFIPSTIFSAENRLDYASLPEYSLYFHPLIDSIVKIWEQQCDFILIDAQAGANPCSSSAIQSSNKVVFVVHPDPLCIDATYSLDATFEDILPDKKNIFCIYNFIQREEAKTYSVIELPHFRDLPPLPFDDDVYMSLKLGKIPFDENNPTAYSLGIIRLAKKLLDVELEQYYKGKVEEKLKEIDSKLKSLRKRLINIFIKGFIIILLALIGVISSTFIFTGRFSILDAVLIGVNAPFLGIVIWFSIDIILYIRGLHAISEETIFYLKVDQRKYETLKLTMEVFDT